MPSTPSWFWYNPTPWPGFTLTNQDNIGTNGNGRVIDPAGYTPMIWNDANSDGVINDADTDDGTGTLGDTITIGTTPRTVHEVGVYLNSTVVQDGVTYTVPMVVWVFTDGTFAIRINDANIPAGHHKNVTALRLGTYNNTEYNGTFVALRDDPFVCFAAETLIQTDRGARRADQLRAGDRVLTADRSYQPLRWIGTRTVAGHGSAAPVQIAKGVMGNDRTLRISQQHRMVLRGWKAQLLSGSPEVLVPAHQLVNGHDITLAPCAAVTYVHLLFDQHEIVYAEGIASESFHPGSYGLSRLDTATLAEVLTLFPELADQPQTYGPTARPCLRAHEARALAA